MCFSKAGLTLNKKKCRWFQSSTPFLGHTISSEGLQQDPQKVKAVKEWVKPTCRRNLKAFLGLASYYRRFVPKFAELAKPLHRLTSESYPFIWSEEANQSFHNLKQLLTSSELVLSYPDVGKPFILDVDTSMHGIGAVLSQVLDNKERAVEYFSKSLSDSERNYCATRLELLGLVTSLKHFHHYLCGSKCTVRTDHAALLWLNGFKRVEGQLARWMESLQMYDVDIAYRRGLVHNNADSLSRRLCGKDCQKCSKVERLNVQTVTLDPQDTIQWESAQKNDTDLEQLCQWIKEGKRPEWNCISGGSTDLRSYWSQFASMAIESGVTVRKFQANQSPSHQIVIPLPERTKILKLIHGNKIHPGISRTLEILKSRFYWPTWRRDVYDHVTTCRVCKQVNGNRRKRNQAFRQFLSGTPWQRIMVDFFGPLPMSGRGNRYILVFMDQFSKWVECFATPDCTAETVSKYLIEEIVCRYGVPYEIHSDQGRVFVSQLITQLCAKLNIHKTRTTPYRPQSDGQVERFMQFLGRNLAKLTAGDQKNWDEMMPWVAFAYRSTVHAATECCPSEIFLGRNLRLPVDILTGKRPEGTNYPCENLQQLDQRINLLWSNVREKLWKKCSRASKIRAARPTSQTTPT